MSAPLVAIDARMTRQMSVGMKTYVRELVRRLPKVAPDMRFVALTDEELELHADMGVLRIDKRDAANGSFGELFGLAKRINAVRPVLGHYPTPYAPRWSPFPYVYTIHDLIHRRFPHYHSWKIPPYYALLVGPVARAAAAVIVPTKATVSDARAYLGVEPDRVRPVAMGVAEPFAASAGARAGVAARTAGRAVWERFGLAQTYFLYAGNHRKHKNVETLVAAWSRLDDACDLAITEDDPFDFDIDRYEKRGGRIVRLGHVGEHDLIALYAGSSGVVQPSLYEGFGLTVIEAMAAGAPCIVADTPALVETAGGAALTFPPRDVDALARALAALLHDRATVERLRLAGRARAALFSWDATARNTAAVYREAIGNVS